MYFRISRRFNRTLRSHERIHRVHLINNFILKRIIIIMVLQLRRQTLFLSLYLRSDIMTTFIVLFFALIWCMLEFSINIQLRFVPISLLLKTLEWSLAIASGVPALDIDLYAVSFETFVSIHDLGYECFWFFGMVLLCLG